ncbi:Modification methylase DpnIIB [Fundidesulfovibrio magnetotacticus]|uniref:Methyltransferase n=1 Tax=Fundidesulfovibrio magnetotacticus TaxID=2730080 RepID=A0A6V8LPB4_9BACT|nr:site-specific DNA-methyltransferase [Fundidesulfovibrio magnetotacticus]GFK94403.1 Modification methylase DpnIIB [Fundidesulfovibrio magnetotacticus]
MREVFENGIVSCGDALGILREMPGASVDAVLTDPPYSSGGLHMAARQADPADKYQRTGTKRTYPPMLGDLKDQRSFTMWATLWLGECWRVSRSGAPCMVFSDWRQLPAMTDALQGAGWAWRGIVVWHKPSARPNLGEFKHDTEFVLYAVKDKARPTHRRCLPGVFKHAVNTARKVHVTGKPVELVKDLLAVTPEGATVLDPFMGGGTTALACLETKRRFVGAELSPEYMDLLTARIRQAEEALKQA